MGSSKALNKSSVIEKFRRHDNDCGSAEVQIAILTERINHLAGHFAVHRNDKHSRRGMINLVNKRKKLLKYLRESNPEVYKETIAKLGLRK
ncbi:MAG: 30S ribosomal protein S15 [Candidatus Dadabacteria bacterium]|nr:MAG: 30S ribosomal protein S15 [Candidatus Dadabacteria bacterium]